MSFMSKYLQYISIVVLGFFILTYASIIQADEINEVTVEEAILNWVNLDGKTIMVPGHLFFVFDDNASDISVDWEDLVIFQHKMQGALLFVNASKISKKQKKWVKMKKFQLDIITPTSITSYNDISYLICQLGNRLIEIFKQASSENNFLLKENVVLKWVHRFGIDSLNDLLIHSSLQIENQRKEENQEQNNEHRCPTDQQGHQDTTVMLGVEINP